MLDPCLENLISKPQPIWASLNLAELFSLKQKFSKPEEKKPLAIAIDYDDTFTANPEMWLNVMQVMHSFGCNIFIVTYRHDNQQESQDLEFLKHYDFVTGIVFTSRKGKKEFCTKLNIHIDIWIDDNPITITHSMKGISIDNHYLFSLDAGSIAFTLNESKSEDAAEYEKSLGGNVIPFNLKH